MACEIYLIRHGETDCNAAGSHQVYTTPLSLRGQEQAKLLAERLRTADAHALYASDLTRAMQTADAIAATTGLKVRHDPRLREHDIGIFKGLTRDQAVALNADAYASAHREDCDACCPEGESPRQVSERMAAALAAIAAAHDGQRVLIVTHGRALRCALMSLLYIPGPKICQLATPNTGINIIHLNDGPPRVVTWGDIHHLPERLRT